MASSNPIILSSSSPASWVETTPPRETNWISVMSSSPGLPSPLQLFKQKRQGMSGNRVVPVANGAIGAFVKASVLLEKEDTIGGVAPSARFGLVVGEKEGKRGYNVVDDQGDHRPVAGRAVEVPFKELGAPRRRVGGKKNAEIYLRDGVREATTATGVTLAHKTKAPRKNAAAGGKKLSSTLVTKDDDEDIIPCEPAPIKKPKASRKKSIAFVEEVDTAFADDRGQETMAANPVPTKKPRAPRKKTADIQPAEPTILEGDTEASKAIEAAPVKKPRAKKTKDDGQTKLSKGRVVKPSTGEELGESAKTKRSSKKRKSDPEDDLDLSRARDAPQAKGPPEPLGLDKATTRRRDWTPVDDRDKETVDDPRGLNGAEPRFSDMVLTIGTPAANNLGAHLSNYGYQKIVETGPAPPNIPARNIDSQAPTKRRKLELIDTPNYPPPEAKAVKKAKPLKKKPQTITEKATAPFLPEKPPAASPLLQYFTQPTSQHDRPVQAAEAEPAKQPVKAPGRKSTSKVTKSKVVKANATKPGPILLPPEEAIKAMKDQDLLFGTSSQLVCDDSPTFVRDLQQAIKASESFHVLPDTPAGDAANTTHLTGSTVLRRKSSRNLWSEAARDSQGSLLEPEVIDLLDTPIPRESMRLNLTSLSLLDESKAIKPFIDNTSWAAIDDVQPPPLETATEASMAKSVIPGTTAVPHDTLHPLPRCIAETALRPRPKSRSPDKKKKLSSRQDDTTSQMPSFQGYTTNQLCVAISKYGFKPIRGRAAMIALLEKCWESKTSLALQSLPPNANVPSLAPPSDQTTASPAKRKGRPPKVKDVSTAAGGPSKNSISPTKPRGRPKKSALPPATTISNGPQGTTQAPTATPKSKAKRKAVTDDMEGPDPQSTPSPPRRRSPLSPPRALPLAGLSKPTTSSAPSLFAKITEAITCLPPSNDPQKLTWHEKILLYDPIVLEDLAAWLNTEGLGRVGVDEEVGAEVVKEWCEGRSVCCLWRQGRNGKRGEAAGKR